MVKKEILATGECQNCGKDTKLKAFVDLPDEPPSARQVQIESGANTIQTVIEKAGEIAKPDPHTPTLKDSKLPKHLKDFYCPDCGLHKNNVHGSYEKPKRVCKTCGNTMNEEDCPMCKIKTKKIRKIELDEDNEEDIEYGEDED